MYEPIFLTPVFKERIWGGTQLHDRFGYDIPSTHTGECWAISAHPNGPSLVSSGKWKGLTLREVWQQHPEVFGGKTESEFPLLVKILDANTDLSVQVHPDDTYANEHENGALGKTECWYILDCAKDSTLIYGHTAKTKQELQTMIKSNEWNDLLKYVSIQPGDFFYVPSGTVHALGKGTLVLEVQQSSDVTYRLYDYERTDGNGVKRELHLDKAIDVITVPAKEATKTIKTEQFHSHTFTTLVEVPYFSVYKVDIHSKFQLENQPTYLLINVIKGTTQLQIEDKEYSLSSGDHFLLPSGFRTCAFEGNAELIITHP